MKLLVCYELYEYAEICTYTLNEGKIETGGQRQRQTYNKDIGI